MKNFLINISLWLLPLALPASIIFIYVDRSILSKQTGDLEFVYCFTADDKPEGYRSSIIYEEPLHELRNDVYYEEQTSCDTLRYMLIGDSFSHQSGIGYIDYCASYLQQEVTNIMHIGENPFQNAINLLNTGFFERHNTEVLVIESVARSLFWRIEELDFNTNISLNHILAPTPSESTNEGEGKGTFQFSEFNSKLKRIYNIIAMKLTKEIEVIELEVEEGLFSSGCTTLYAHNDDVELLKGTYEPLELSKDLATLKKLEELFANKGVTLYIYIIADKYDVYQSFAKNNPYPAVDRLDILTQNIKNERFINTKDILLPHLHNRTQDLYYIEDTHWTPIGAKIAGEALAKELKNE